MNKQLIIPVVTPAGIPAEKDLPIALHTEETIVHGAEGESWKQHVVKGAPQNFHDACRRLLGTFADRASGVLVGGTTGEGVGMGPLQYLVLLHAMKQACPANISLYAGVLGADTLVEDQVRSAQALGIQNIVLGLNHTRNNEARFQAAIRSLGDRGRLFLYNLPTFRPAEKSFILRCLDDPRIVGFKDSSDNVESFKWLLSLKKHRPDLQVFHGVESAYGELSPEDFDRVAGLVSGNANAHPALLHAYTNNPRHTAHFGARAELHDDIGRLSGRSRGSAVEAIEAHIHGLKKRLVRLCISPYSPEVTILSPGHDALYVYKPGSLFKTYCG